MVKINNQSWKSYYDCFVKFYLYIHVEFIWTLRYGDGTYEYLTVIKSIVNGTDDMIDVGNVQHNNKQ